MAAGGMFPGRQTEDQVTLPLRRVWIRQSFWPAFTMAHGCESWLEGAGISLNCQEPWLPSFFFLLLRTQNASVLECALQPNTQEHRER